MQAGPRQGTRRPPGPRSRPGRAAATVATASAAFGLYIPPTFIGAEMPIAAHWLDDAFIALLREHRDAQVLQALTADREWQENDLVFCQWNGRAIDPRADWGEWISILEEAKVPRRTVHAMRHSAATIALESGIALPVVQEMLGHPDIRVTRRYSHVGKPLAQDASRQLGEALGLPQRDAQGS